MNMQNIRPSKYLRYLVLPTLFGTQRTKEILVVNPTAAPEREEAQQVSVSVFSYDAETLEEKKFDAVADLLTHRQHSHTTWINIDGLRKVDVEAVCNRFGIHPLLMEDILSINQRPKVDEVDGILFCLLNMLYYNNEKQTVEQEQISIALGKGFVVSFQEDAKRDVFNPLRDRLKLTTTKVRQSGADYLCYSMLDLIVDNYYVVMEKLGDRIEMLEEEVVRNSNTRTLAKVNQLRKELIVLKRNIAPVRDLINGFIRSESDLLDDRTTK